MKTVRHASRARIAAMGLATSGALLLAGCGAANETAAPPASGAGGGGAASVSGTISGAGSSAQQAAMEAWIAGFTAVSPDATINYDPSGSGAGRDQFTGGGVAFAGSDFGTMLYDATGQPIYLFDVETGPRSRCYGACAQAWPPVLTKGRPTAGKGARRGLLGTIRRRDGSTQVTYRGHPLYYYVTDSPGRVLCQNVTEFGGTWLVVRANGSAVR